MDALGVSESFLPFFEPHQEKLELIRFTSFGNSLGEIKLSTHNVAGNCLFAQQKAFGGAG
jgi:hypothetical protein